ncbi:ABC transporter permease [Weissella kandleri]|uniref:ABC transporter permease n=1 Tax=Weissella kandleri TaxID=1616 RepID=UPI00387E7F72
MRIWSIAKRVLKELLRDKRTLALMFLAPLLVLSLMKVIFNTSSDVTTNVGTIGVPTELAQNLQANQNMYLTRYRSEHAANQALQDQKLDAIIEAHNQDFKLTYANVDASKTAMVKNSFKAAQMKQNMEFMQNKLQTFAQMSGGQMPVMTKSQIQNVYVYGDAKTTYFDKIVPILMGFFVFFFVFLISGMALLKERTTGTLGRLLATPVRRSEIVFGYMVSYGTLAVLQTLVIVSFTIWFLKVELVGSILGVIGINILLALVALAFGILMSTFAKSEFQMMQFIPLVVVPQIFFSGLISLDSMADWLRIIADFMPLKYAGHSLTQIIMSGDRIGNIWLDIVVLGLFLVILTWLNILGLKRYRKV